MIPPSHACTRCGREIAARYVFPECTRCALDALAETLRDSGYDARQRASRERFAEVTDRARLHAKGLL